MKNLLIVESENDKYFIEALIKHMNLGNVEVSNGFICSIDDFECLGGLNSSKLTAVLNNIKSRAKKDDINRIGIIIDNDDKTDTERLSLVNNSIKESLGMENSLKEVSVFSEIPIDAYQNISIAAYFTNVEKKGELETVLKTIKSDTSTYADCLENWQSCLKSKNVNNGLGLKSKDFDKFWVQVYIRYDTCTKKEQKQAGKYCSNEFAMSKSIWNFDNECLNEFKAFLNLFAPQN